LQLIRPADHRQMAWRNGGGETSEIAAAPGSAASGAFA
jgi:environmental stress-induced protein Ves